MAVTVADKGSVRGTGALSVTGVTAGSTLVVFAYTYDDNDYTISSDVDGALTKSVDYFYYSGFETYYVSVWTKVNASAGTHSITLGNATSANSMRWCFEVLSADASSSFDTNVNNTATGTSIGVGPITNAVADSALLSFVTGQGSANYSGMSGWTLSAQSTDATYGRNARAGYLVKSASEATSATWNSDQSYRILTTVVAIKGGGGGSSFVPQVVMVM